MAQAARSLTLDIPAPMEPFLFPARHKVALGGRGGGKSWAVARLLLIRGLQRPTRILCAREVQKSLRDSVYRLLCDQIRALGLESLYKPLASSITGPNGTEILFAGLRDHTVESIKSYEGIDICWIEEAQTVSAHSAQILIPSIRSNESELWWTYNPDQADDYVHDRFVVRGDDQAVVCRCNWRDNPWFPAVLDKERLALKALNDDLYRHVWEGECRSESGVLFKRDWFKPYTSAPKRLSVYMASDYAVTPESEGGGDYTEHGIFGLDEHGDTYVLDWWSGQAAPEVWIDSACQLIERWRPLAWFEEKGAIRRAVDGAIAKRLRERRVVVYRHGLPSASSKAERALGFAARASAGAVYVPRDLEWSDRLVNQLCAFTGEPGKTDDMVDVCSLFARGLDLTQDALPEPQVDEKPVIPFTRRWIEGLDRQSAHEQAEKERYYR